MGLKMQAILIAVGISIFSLNASSDGHGKIVGKRKYTCKRLYRVCRDMINNSKASTEAKNDMHKINKEMRETCLTDRHLKKNY